MRKTKLLGLRIPPGSAFEFEGPSSGIEILLLHASLASDANRGSRATLILETNGKKMVVGALKSHLSSFMKLELSLVERAVVTVKGNADVHLVGLQMEALDKADPRFRDEQVLHPEDVDLAAEQLENQEMLGEDVDPTEVDHRSAGALMDQSNLLKRSSTPQKKSVPGGEEVEVPVRSGKERKKARGAAEDSKSLTREENEVKAAGREDTKDKEEEESKGVSIGGQNPAQKAKKKRARKRRKKRGAEPKMDGDGDSRLADVSKKEEVKSTPVAFGKDEKYGGQNEGSSDHVTDGGNGESKEEAKKKKTRKRKQGKDSVSETVADDDQTPAASVKSKKEKKDRDAPTELPNPENESRKSKKRKKKSKKASEKERGEGECDGSSPVAGLKDGSSSDVLKFDNGYTIERLVTREYGGQAEPGNRVEIKYKGVDVKTGKVIDKNRMKMVVGGGEVIKGLDCGLEGMRVGEKRRLVIPPQMGYGEEGVKGHVSQNATLQFDVELLQLKPSKVSSR